MPNRIITAEVVSVFTYGRGRHRAECSCGYGGRLRWRMGSAVMDMADHAGDTGCGLNERLVVDVSSAPLPVSARRRSPWWVWTTAAGSIIGAALYFSAPAQADPLDDAAFLATLDLFNVDYSTPPAAVALGQQVCLGLDNGLTPARIEHAITDRTNFTLVDAEVIVGAAVGAMCDRHMDQVDGPPATSVRTDFGPVLR